MTASKLTTAQFRRFLPAPVDCDILRERIDSLSDFFSVVDRVTSDEIFWFRGHASVSWSLIPSALRYPEKEQRQVALDLLDEFRRIAELKIPRPPSANERLKWVQVAQHYGLPTRLLDWTESATIGLYFACLREDENGMLFILKPAALNALGPAQAHRPLTAREDEALISEYLALTGRSQGRRGRPALAISPVWNSERLILQRGAFTLHGSRFELDRDQAPSLVGVPVLRESKVRLRSQLARIGVDRLTIFPELEHACMYLKSKVAQGAQARG